MTRQQWRKLMYVPEKKDVFVTELTRDAVLTLTGYNAAIDDMLRGGE